MDLHFDICIIIEIMFLKIFYDMGKYNFHLKCNTQNYVQDDLNFLQTDMDVSECTERGLEGNILTF